MTTKPSHPRRPYWYTMLAMIALLAFELVHGASIDCSVDMEQHARCADQWDVRVKRQLRSNVEMTEKREGDQEERLPVIDFVYADEKLGDAAAYFRENVIESKNLISPEDIMTSTRIKNWAEKVDNALPGDNAKAEDTKILQLILHYGADMFKMVNKGAGFSGVRVKYDKRLLALTMHNIAKGDTNVEMIAALAGNDGRKFLECLVWLEWMKRGNDESKRELYKTLFSYLTKWNDKKRVKAIFETKYQVKAEVKDEFKAEAVKLATKMEMLQLNEWSKAEFTGLTLFEHLGLAKTGSTMRDADLWDAWVIYTTKTEGEQGLLKILFEKFGRTGVTELIESGKKGNDMTKMVAERLERLVKTVDKRIREHLGVTTTRKRQSEKAPDRQ